MTVKSTCRTLPTLKKSCKSPPYLKSFVSSQISTCSLFPLPPMGWWPWTQTPVHRFKKREMKTPIPIPRRRRILTIKSIKMHCTAIVPMFEYQGCLNLSRRSKTRNWPWRTPTWNLFYLVCTIVPIDARQVHLTLLCANSDICTVGPLYISLGTRAATQPWFIGEVFVNM